MSERASLVAFLNKSGFPKITEQNLIITSPIDPHYNCIAWAASENIRWWWPDPMNQAYWPSSAPRQINVPAFIAAYSTLGYQVCANAKEELGFEKIVIYCKEGVPTHAARHIQGLVWTSKLGQGNDISHGIHLLDGPAYGDPHTYMKRPLAVKPSQNNEPPSSDKKKLVAPK